MKESYMAERIVRVLVDDMDQTEIVDGSGGSIKFALRDTTYTIDLNEANTAKLEAALAPFIAAATRTSGPNGKRGRRATKKISPRVTRRSPRSTKKANARSSNRSTARPSNAEIRAWAMENGHSVSSKGRISRSVVDAYNEAQAKRK
jgi:nucleoid-associated protein Lsr2